MDSSKFNAQSSGFHVRPVLTTVFAIAGLAALVYCILAGVFGERATPTASAQSDMYLSRRIDQVEQRFYGIESRLSRLEMQTRPTTVSPPLTSSNNQTELEFLRSQVNSLRTRIGEAECALLRIDERTLTAAARTARARIGPRDSDKCRTDLVSPIQLSARP